MVEQTAGSKTTLTAQAAWLAAGKTLAFALAFALPLLLVRRLSQSEFGLYKQVFLFVSTAMVMLPVGLPMSVYYFFPREPERRPQVVLHTLIFLAAATAFACLALLLRPSLLSSVFNSEAMAAYAPAICLVVVTWVVSSFLDYVILARQETKLATALIVASQLTKTFLLLGAVLISPSVRSLIYAAIIQGALQTIVLFVYLRSRFPRFWRSFDRPLWREQLHYSLPLGAASVMLFFQTTLDNYFVSSFYGPEAYAVYAIGCFQLPLFVILGESIGLTAIPRVSLLQQQGKTREITELLARMARKQSFIYLPAFALLLVVGREFLVLLFTRQYLASWPIFAVNLVLIPLAIVASAADPVMRAYSEHRYFLLRMRVALLALLAAGLWFGTGRYGLLGAITIMAGVNVLQGIVLAAKVGRILGFARRDLALFKDLWKIALASAGAGAAAWLARSFVQDAHPLVVLVVCGLIFALAYLALVHAFGVLTDDERGALRRGAARVQRQVFSKLTSPTAGGY